MLQEIERFNTNTQLHTVYRLQHVIEELQQAIAECRNARSRMSAMARELYGSMLPLQDILVRHAQQGTVLRRTWLAWWDTNVECVSKLVPQEGPEYERSTHYCIKISKLGGAETKLALARAIDISLQCQHFSL